MHDYTHVYIYIYIHTWLYIDVDIHCRYTANFHDWMPRHISEEVSNQRGLPAVEGDDHQLPRSEKTVFLMKDDGENN